MISYKSDIWLSKAEIFRNHYDKNNNINDFESSKEVYYNAKRIISDNNAQKINYALNTLIEVFSSAFSPYFIDDFIQPDFIFTFLINAFSSKAVTISTTCLYSDIIFILFKNSQETAQQFIKSFASQIILSDQFNQPLLWKLLCGIFEIYDVDYLDQELFIFAFQSFENSSIEVQYCISKFMISSWRLVLNTEELIYESFSLIIKNIIKNCSKCFDNFCRIIEETIIFDKSIIGDNFSPNFLKLFLHKLIKMSEKYIIRAMTLYNLLLITNYDFDSPFFNADTLLMFFNLYHMENKVVMSTMIYHWKRFFNLPKYVDFLRTTNFFHMLYENYEIFDFEIKNLSLDLLSFTIDHVSVEEIMGLIEFEFILKFFSDFNKIEHAKSILLLIFNVSSYIDDTLFFQLINELDLISLLDIITAYKKDSRWDNTIIIKLSRLIEIMEHL